MHPDNNPIPVVTISIFAAVGFVVVFVMACGFAVWCAERVF